MENNEYKDNEKVLYKTRCELSVPHKTPEEVDCFITESHIVIETKGLLEIPLSCIEDIQ